MRILKSVEKVPGGLMLVPPLLGAVCKTFAPGAGSYSELQTCGAGGNGAGRDIVPGDRNSRSDPQRILGQEDGVCCGG